MQSAVSPEQLQLALRLRKLRLEQWPDSKLTQSVLATILGGEEPLSPATVASWENRAAPKVPPRDRILAYAQFFATRRSMEPTPKLVPIESFTLEEQASYEALRDELLRLHAATSGSTQSDLIVGRGSWHFTDSGPLTLICAQLPEEETGPLAKASDPNHTELMSYADLDAMVELLGHVRMENPPMDVFFKSAPNVAPDDLSGHLVIIGGIGWNDVTKRILDLTRLPVTQKEIPAIQSGEIFVTSVDGEQKEFLPQWSQTNPAELVQDVGLLVRMPNPLNSKRTLTMCNGIHSRGVYGAVRSLTDKRLRESNEQYIARNFRDSKEFGVLIRIQVIGGKAMTPDFNTEGTVLYQWPVRSDIPQSVPAKSGVRA
jgi:hypothetical protein